MPSYCILGRIKLRYTINEIINKYVSDNLKDIDFTRNDILVITSSVLNTKKDKLLLDLNTRILEQNEIDSITNNLNKYYFEKIPLQYITGKQNFFNEEYVVNENVLIPRQDSEILVEEAIKYINNENLNTMLDMCTGSGALGISIANNSNIAKVTLSDISLNALDVAKENIKLNNVKKDIKVVCSNLFENLGNNKYDIIVSNPPYIKSGDIKDLDEYVKKEPIIALDGGVSGTYFYNAILKEAKRHLNSNGLVIFEIGYDELEALKSIISKYNEYRYIKCVKDLANNDRVVVIRYSGN